MGSCISRPASRPAQTPKAYDLDANVAKVSYLAPMDKKQGRELLKQLKKEDTEFRHQMWRLAEQFEQLHVEGRNVTVNRPCSGKGMASIVQEGIVPFRSRDEPRGFDIGGGASGMQLVSGQWDFRDCKWGCFSLPELNDMVAHAWPLNRQEFEVFVRHHFQLCAKCIKLNVRTGTLVPFDDSKFSFTFHLCGQCTDKIVN